MGHYCRICGRTRANEKFSGKGHKNHVCRDCSGKFGKKANKNSLDKNVFATQNTAASKTQAALISALERAKAYSQQLQENREQRLWKKINIPCNNQKVLLMMTQMKSHCS